jgi:nucleotide-binding universal stress UspA family protein
MEKILLAMDAAHLNEKAIDFACYIAKLTRSRLTGIFLEGEALVTAAVPSDVTESNIHLFREACICRETLSSIHRDRGIPLSEIIAETRFADLLIVDPDTSFIKADRQFPGRFLTEVLGSSECPVLIAPSSLDEAIDEIILSYNGTASSVFAIRQFTSLFPELARKKVYVVNVRQDNTSAIEDQFKMKEWLKVHYENIEFVLLKGDASDQLFGYLLQKKNAIVVMGAYGRNMISRFFKPSHAKLIVRTINLPIFIAHH